MEEGDPHIFLVPFAVAAVWTLASRVAEWPKQECLLHKPCTNHAVPVLQCRARISCKACAGHRAANAYMDTSGAAFFLVKSGEHFMYRTTLYALV